MNESHSGYFFIWDMVNLPSIQTPVTWATKKPQNHSLGNVSEETGLAFVHYNDLEREIEQTLERYKGP